MARYVDGFLIPISKRNIGAYRKIAAAAGKVWMELGALEYRECVGDDLASKMGVSFPKSAKAKRGETVLFSWIVYKSRAHRDAVNAKVLKDPRIAKMMKRRSPFDAKRMAYGGFEIIVDL